MDAAIECSAGRNVLVLRKAQRQKYALNMLHVKSHRLLNYFEVSSISPLRPLHLRYHSCYIMVRYQQC